MYVLDTNAVSALMRGNPHVVAHLDAVEGADIAIPHPVIAEIAYGIERLPPSRRRDKLRDDLAAIREAIVRLPWTDDVSDRFGLIKAQLERRGARLEDFDLAIAAHALAADATLVTTDARHMRRIPGLLVEDWSRAP